MMTTLKRGQDVLVGENFNDENPLKGLRSVPIIVDRGEEEYLGRRGKQGVGGLQLL